MRHTQMYFHVFSNTERSGHQTCLLAKKRGKVPISVGNYSRDEVPWGYPLFHTTCAQFIPQIQHFKQQKIRRPVES